MKIKNIKKTCKNLLLVGCITGMMLMTVTGCGGNQTASEGQETAEGMSGTVVIAGSTSVQPLSEVIAEEFMNKNTGVVVEVQGGGSGQGIKSITEGISDIGSLSRNVKDEEKSEISEEITIAMDGIAVVVNHKTKIEDLTIDQIKDIYTGKITNWSEVGGENEEIVVVTREEGSGTRGAFTEITGVLSKDASGTEVDGTTVNALVQPSTGAVKHTVANTPNSIGYVSLGSMDNSVKAVKVEGIEATSENVIAEAYKISRPFIYVTGGEISAEAQAYIDFALSEDGQNLVQENGFIPVK